MGQAGDDCGISWMLLRPAISATFSRPLFGLTYIDYNRLMIVPLVLLMLACVALWTSSRTRLGRAGSVIVLVGLGASLAGVFVEFALGRGLGGDRDLALLGWGIYEVGLLGQVIGLAVFSFACLRAGARASGSVALAMALLHLAWLPLLAVRLGTVAVADQILIGAGWVAPGALSFEAGSRTRSC